ncbi:hypothetical protein [Novosphingobium sp. ZW T3_23]|uniref:hypothetical protein n=1 Tax=Novosphingobium sp. ZW T3_23 TaxID=3378084 RepID=UPI003853B289
MLMINSLTFFACPVAEVAIVQVVSMSLISNAEKISRTSGVSLIEKRNLPRAPARIAARRSKSPRPNAPAPNGRTPY